MTFGDVPVTDAVGVVLAHTVRADGKTFKKGTTVTRPIATHLAAAGLASVIAARLSPDDVGEDEAARRIAEALAGEGIVAEAPFTGRVNLFAQEAGVLAIDVDIVNRLNRVDPAITLATLPVFDRVEPGRMIATVKIIPLAVPSASIRGALAVIEATTPLSVRSFLPHRVGLIQTELPTVKPSVLDKTRRVLEDRLKGTGAVVMSEARVPHDTNAVAQALGVMDADLVIIFGASAVIDAADVLPDGVERAGGEVLHLGMPVDPGNLLMLARIGDATVIGAPGCARSPKENGFDWVLHRLLAGIEVTATHIMGMGVGGLLMEIVTRPQPRAPGHDDG